MSKEQYEKGLAVRRAVLGEEHVNASVSNADAFSRPLQQLVTENAWGAVWTREELPRKTRSMITLAMLTALNRPHEIKLHLHGALRNGVTREEIREIFLHASAYCGWPATLDGFRLAKEVFAEVDAKV
ncbi:MAG: carboxymuconolactone decarboxylase family protein [Deltaproteobacteria bacterium]|nr:carboxymuconolactone decarboxylase family protein [Deltaproteobacteria bacterium]